MTTISRIFERRGSRGWVVLAGEYPSVYGSETPALDSYRGIKGRGGALVVLAPGGKIPSSAQPFVNDINAQYDGRLKIIDPSDEDQTLMQTTCQEAQLVLAISGNRKDWIKIFKDERMPADPDLIITENMLFIAIGSLVSLLGEWTYDPESDQISDGIGWFPNAIFLLGSGAPASKRRVRQKLKTQMKSYALSIAPDTIVGVGPQGKVEVWSDAAPEILLGQGWV